MAQRFNAGAESLLSRTKHGGLARHCQPGYRAESARLAGVIASHLAHQWAHQSAAGCKPISGCRP